MVTLVQPSKVSFQDLQPLSRLIPSPSSSPSTSFSSSSSSSCTFTTYKITRRSHSESSWLLFVENEQSEDRLVMKVLQNYRDARYSLETVEKRQHCQLEGLRQNRLFTPEAYLGLARIWTLDPEGKKVTLDALLSEPAKEQLHPQGEYALVMRELPYDRRLDYLLNSPDGDSALLEKHIQLLIERVAAIHRQLSAVESFYIDEEKVRWGSFQQVYAKLRYNLAFIDLVAGNQDSQDRVHYERLDAARRKFLQLVAQTNYEQYFEQRVRERRIKHCHSDLKAANIWIAPDALPEGKDYVWILDAIDFNPLYSNIDILSDFATLVVDVQAHTRSSSLAEDMIKRYMQLMVQDDVVADLVLRYYLVEKAIIGAIVNFVYDRLPDLGMAFLDVVEICLDNLETKIH